MESFKKVGKGMGEKHLGGRNAIIWKAGALAIGGVLLLEGLTGGKPHSEPVPLEKPTNIDNFYRNDWGRSGVVPLESLVWSRDTSTWRKRTLQRGIVERATVMPPTGFTEPGTAKVVNDTHGNLSVCSENDISDSKIREVADRVGIYRAEFTRSATCWEKGGRTNPPLDWSLNGLSDAAVKLIHGAIQPLINGLEHLGK